MAKMKNKRRIEQLEAQEQKAKERVAELERQVSDLRHQVADFRPVSIRKKIEERIVILEHQVQTLRFERKAQDEKKADEKKAFYSPRELADETGVEPKVIRKVLRKHFARDESLKWKHWRISEETATKVRAYAARYNGRRGV